MERIVCSDHAETGMTTRTCVFCRIIVIKSQLKAEVAKREKADEHVLGLKGALRLAKELYAPFKQRAEQVEAELERTKNPKAGICCSCGYTSTDEGPCPRRDDETHCEHWWDGVPEPTQEQS